MNQNTNTNHKGASYTAKISLMAGSLAALAMPESAQAGIVVNNTPFDVTIGTSSPPIEWDIDNGGTFEATFGYYLFIGPVVDFGASGGSRSSGFYFNNSVSLGQTITSGAINAPFQLSIIQTNNINFAGGLSDGETGYIAFKFNLDGSSTQAVGWAEVTGFINNDTSTGITVSCWAYNDMGGSIQVGEGQTQCVSTPEGDTVPGLALLSMGAAGVTAWRKRKQIRNSNQEAA